MVVTNLEEPPSLPEKSNPLSFSEERRKSEALILTESPKLMRRMLSSPKVRYFETSTTPYLHPDITEAIELQDTTTDGHHHYSIHLSLRSHEGITTLTTSCRAEYQVMDSPRITYHRLTHQSPFDPPPQRVVKSPSIFSRSQSLSIDLEQTAFSREESGPPHSARRLFSREDRPIV